MGIIQKKPWENHKNLNLGFRTLTLSPLSPYILGPNLFAYKLGFCYDPSLPIWALFFWLSSLRFGWVSSFGLVLLLGVFCLLGSFLPLGGFRPLGAFRPLGGLVLGGFYHWVGFSIGWVCSAGWVLSIGWV